MKIAIDCRMINSSGIGVYFKNILEHMLLNTSVNFLLLGKKDELVNFQRRENCRIMPVDILPFSIKELIQFPIKEINECDCFYSPNYNIPLGIKVPIACTIHDVVFLDIPHLTSPIGRRIRYIYLKQAILRSNLLFTVSQFSRDRILHYFPGAPSIKITYNGIANKLLVIKEDIKRKYDFSYFLYVGNVKLHKGLRTLLEAYSLLEQYGEKRKLVIVGKYENFKTSDNYVRNLLKKGTLNKNVIFTGYVDDNDLVNIMLFASLLIQPSIYEGFGIPPLESLFLGTPVLLSDIPVFREIYSDFPVEYFSCNDASVLCSKMKKHNDQRITLSSSLKEKYTYKKSAEVILNSINRIIQ